MNFLVQLFHPLGGTGYQFWSGIGSDLSEITLLVGALTLYQHKNCHKKGCWRLGHIDPEHGHPACKKHHSQGNKLG